MVQWLKVCASSTGGCGSILGRELHMSHGVVKNNFFFKKMLECLRTQSPERK